MYDKVLELLQEEYPEIDFTGSDELVDDGILDSLTLTGIIAALSMEFDIEIPYDEIIAGPGKKKDKCIKHKLDIMIEDKASNVLEISDIIPVLCFDAPYNLKIEKNHVHRVYSWYQIYKYFLDNTSSK